MKRIVKSRPKSKSAALKPPKANPVHASQAEPFYAVRKSKIQGRGVFAARPIPKGMRIIEYAGERISHKTASERYDDLSMKRHHTFLFTISSRTCIDGDRLGNDARYINHSCAPNCEALQVGRGIFIFAKKPIAEGEELSYDYAYEVEDPDPSLYPCKCGTAKCRGTMLRKTRVKSSLRG
jgi:uncharacterized protein